MSVLLENWALILALLGCGAVAGFMASIFGVGGGAVVVPALYQALSFLGVDEGVRMHISIATSLAIMIPTSVRSYLSHLKRGAVDTDLLKGWLLLIPLGTVLASLIAAHLSGDVLKGIFGVMALMVAFKLLFSKDNWRLGSNLPGQPVRGLYGMLIGFLSTLMGIGGGILCNTFMTLFGRPIHQAIATSSGVGVLVSLPGMIGLLLAGLSAEGLPTFSLGFVNLLAVILITPVAVLVAPLGVKAAHALSKRQLELAFGLFLIVVGLRFAAALF
ncbi:sulfite exporter TauE/SafE family protein [Coralliovum pocilloporae]|uniref:sulfite exporter TauE/SafE family protein n=1 Tax=Coralliovum pocilloporae TaxID=3066369 RepID=UPI0033075582